MEIDVELSAGVEVSEPVEDETAAGELTLTETLPGELTLIEGEVSA